MYYSNGSLDILAPSQPGLKDDWPAGRPVISQGDVAVGRTSRQDLASMPHCHALGLLEIVWGFDANTISDFDA